MVYAEPNITINANANEYHCVLITGHVTEIIGENPVILKIMSQNGNLVEVRQIDLDENKKFATIAYGDYWNSGSGEFVVEAHHGRISNKTQFTVPSVIHEHGMFSPRVSFDEYGVYMRDLFPGKILNTTINYNEKSITFLIETDPLYYDEDTNCKSTFIAEIPRELFDAKNDSNEDARFIILADGEQINYVESRQPNNYTRYIEATINGNTKELKIIGTHMIPEFGMITVSILITALVLAIIFTKYSRSITQSW